MKKGFSIIELLSVFTILTILSALTYPSFASSRMSAKASAARTQMRGVWLGLKIYQDDYGGESQTYQSWETENLPPADVTILISRKLIAEQRSKQSPCGEVPNYFTFFPAVLYAHHCVGCGRENRNIRANKENTVIAYDPQCNSAVPEPEKQFWLKRSIGICLSGELRDRKSDRWQPFQAYFYGNTLEEN